ncbi:MAG TPA: hypothetical protein VGZ22_31745 [Isosphaeraceae bacterium]|nr:hypothetical protein [Isosphaeraceae bacterium]
MPRLRFRLRTLMIVVAVVGVVLGLWFGWYSRLSANDQVLTFLVLVPSAVVVAPMVAGWINWRAPH